MTPRPAIAGLVALLAAGTEGLKSRPRTSACASAAVPHHAIGATSPDLCTVYCVPAGKCHEWVKRGAVFSDLGINGTGDCARKGFTRDAAPEAAASEQQAFFHSVTGPCEGMTLSRFTKSGASAAEEDGEDEEDGEEDQRASEEEEPPSDDPEPAAAAEKSRPVADEEDEHASEEEPGHDDPEPVADEEDGHVEEEETEERPGRSTAAGTHKKSLDSLWSKLGSRVGSGLRSIWKELGEDLDDESDDEESSTAGSTSSDREQESAASESSEDEEAHHDRGGQADEEDEDDGEGPATRRKRHDNATRFW